MVLSAPKFSFFLILFLPFNLLGSVIHVKPLGTGMQNGLTWDDAFNGTNLQSIIGAANAGDTIWISCGIYFPTNGNDRSISFSMKNGVQIYGGFVGSETSLSLRDLSCGPCSILSGDIGNTGLPGNFSHTVISNVGLDNTAVLDGFTIENGNDNSGLSNGGAGLGGGIYNHGPFGGSCSPTFRNLLIRNNSARFGGGAFNNGFQGGTSNPIYINCIFYNNHAVEEAGGMDSYGVNGNANPTLYNCIFYENTSDNSVGAMYAWGGNGGNANVTMYNCVFAQNHALSGYAGAFIADGEGGGGIVSGTSIITAQNCIIWGNTSTSGSDQFVVDGTSNNAQFIATYSNVDMSNQMAPDLISGNGIGNIITNPSFLDIGNGLGPDLCWFTDDDGLSLDLQSPNVNAGSPSGSLDFDLLQKSRISGSAIDIGPYEYPLMDSVTWTGTNNSDWFEAENWLPARVPDATQIITIPPALVPMSSPIIANGTAVGKSIVIQGMLHIDNTGELILSNF